MKPPLRPCRPTRHPRRMIRVFALAALTSCSPPAWPAPTCTVASGATLAFGPVIALASTPDQTTNSGASFWVSCNAEVTTAPTLYSASPRIMTSGADNLPFRLSLNAALSTDLPASSPGEALNIARDGSNHTVPLYGRIATSDFKALPAGSYTATISLTLEY